MNKIVAGIFAIAIITACAAGYSDSKTRVGTPSKTTLVEAIYK